MVSRLIIKAGVLGCRWMFLLAGFVSVVYGQQGSALPMKYSQRDGTYLYFSDRALSTATPLNTITQVRVSRNTGRGFKELIVVSRVSDSKAFKKIAGSQTWSQLRILKNLSSDAVAWKYILDHPLLNDYGTMAFDMGFRQAMGSGFLDKEAAGLAAGKQWTYRVEWLDAAGTVIQSSEGTITGGFSAFGVGPVNKARAFATDSIVYVQWFAISRQSSDAIVMADIFRQTGGKGAYEKLDTKLFAIQKGDSLLFNFRDDVVPKSLYRYYIRATDELGNRAAPSDTISVLSFNFATLPLLQDVSASDTLNGIQLKWKSLGDLPQVTGIEIQRSRDVRGNYVILDTISVTQGSFFDAQVLPDIPYYYRLRLIALRGMERESGYSGYATAVVKNQFKNPDPPYALEGNIVNGKIHLTWQAVSDPDVYGFFVYRSISDQEKFEVISPGLQTLEFTDTSSVSGRTQYVYAVKAVNSNSLESDYSNVVTMRQPVMNLPDAPRGIQAYLDNRKVVLLWPTASKTDHAIAGYNIYKRELQSQSTFDLKQSAAAQAVSLKFVLINSSVIVQPHFEDRDVVSGKTYEYAVASVDVFGMESTYSSFVSVTIETPTRIVSTCNIRKISTGIELSWDPSLSEGADVINIYRKKVGEMNYQRIGSLRDRSTSYLDKTATKGSLYIYVVSAESGKTILAKSEEKNIRY